MNPSTFNSLVLRIKKVLEVLNIEYNHKLLIEYRKIVQYKHSNYIIEVSFGPSTKESEFTLINEYTLLSMNSSTNSVYYVLDKTYGTMKLESIDDEFIFNRNLISNFSITVQNIQGFNNIINNDLGFSYRISLI